MGVAAWWDRDSLQWAVGGGQRKTENSERQKARTVLGSGLLFYFTLLFTAHRSLTAARYCYFFGVTFSTNASLWPPLVGWYINSPRAGGSVNSPANSAIATNSATVLPICS